MLQPMHNILISMIGLTPQILTEALYAFYIRQIEIHEIHVITTREGKNRILLHLIGNQDGQYYKFLDEYGINMESIKFFPDNLHVLRDDDGRELDDINSIKDNEILFRTTFNLVKELTNNDTNRIFFLIAGGRKTMSACLTVAAQFYGRKHDKLYHILVSSEFENCKDFFYPPRNSRLIELTDIKGEKYFKDTKYAIIELIELPLISIRDKILSKLQDDNFDPLKLLDIASEIEKEKLILDLKESKIIYLNKSLNISPIYLSLYVYFAEKKLTCKSNSSSCLDCKDCYIDISTILNETKNIEVIYSKIVNKCKTNTKKTLISKTLKELNADDFNSLKSSINKQLRNYFGYSVSKKIEITSIGKRPNKIYGIEINKDHIVISS